MATPSQTEYQISLHNQPPSKVYTAAGKKVPAKIDVWAIAGREFETLVFGRRGTVSPAGLGPRPPRRIGVR
jgi:hypothetical protein